MPVELAAESPGAVGLSKGGIADNDDVDEGSGEDGLERHERPPRRKVSET